jgi:hypothetical protein
MQRKVLLQIKPKKKKYWGKNQTGVEGARRILEMEERNIKLVVVEKCTD